jgi:hypothetical protein
LRDERQYLAGPQREAQQIKSLLHRRVVHHFGEAGERADHLIGFAAPLRQSFQHPDDPHRFGCTERKVILLNALA